jgi:hypothetical protein
LPLFQSLSLWGLCYREAHAGARGKTSQGEGELQAALLIETEVR